MGSTGFTAPIGAIELELSVAVMDAIEVAPGVHLNTTKLKMQGAQKVQSRLTP